VGKSEAGNEARSQRASEDGSNISLISRESSSTEYVQDCSAHVHARVGRYVSIIIKHNNRHLWIQVGRNEIKYVALLFFCEATNSHVNTRMSVVYLVPCSSSIQ
jgi:hypothetical protein